MRVSDFLKHHLVTILIDSGSTNNSLDEGISKRLSIPIDYCKQFEVKLLDRRALTCQGKCPKHKTSSAGPRVAS